MESERNGLLGKAVNTLSQPARLGRQFVERVGRATTRLSFTNVAKVVTWPVSAVMDTDPVRLQEQRHTEALPGELPGVRSIINAGVEAPDI